MSYRLLVTTKNRKGRLKEGGGQGLGLDQVHATLEALVQLALIDGANTLYHVKGLK